MAAGFDRSPRYLVHQRLAAGGMGEVYLGTMVSYAGRRPVAIKRLAVERLREQGAVARLVAEARLGFQLTHASVCQVLDLVFDEQGAYIVMEYVRGLDLRALLQRRAEPDPATALYVAREVARALDYAHRLSDEGGRSLHVVHGDVTPQNILLSLEGEVKLADFGIARALGTSAPGTDVLGGTRGYIAPEILSGAVDHRSDIYSLGATLHAALVGEPPRTPGSAALLRARPEVPGEVAAVVERAIAREPRDRYLSAGELERALAFELARRHPGYTPSALAAQVRGARRTEDEEASADGDGSTTLFALATQASTRALDDATEVVPPWQQPAALERRTGPARGTETVSRLNAPPRRRLLAAGAAAALAAALAVVVAWWLRAPTLGAAAPPDAAVVLAAAAAAADAAVPAAGPPDAGPPDAAPPDAAPPVVAPEPPRADRQRSRERPRRRRAYLSVNAIPWGAVEVDGRRVASETPVYRLPVAPGERTVVVVFGDGERSAAKTITLRPGQHESLGFRR